MFNTSESCLLLTVDSPWPEVSEESHTRLAPGQHQPAPGLGAVVTVWSLCPGYLCEYDSFP